MYDFTQKILKMEMGMKVLTYNTESKEKICG
jgi:hypothetical protein